MRAYPQNCWSIYYNPWCETQTGILGSLEGLPGAGANGSHINRCPVRAEMLSLAQHLEFFTHRCQADLYHYPHFDLPVGLQKVRLVITIHDLYPLIIDGYCSAVKRIYFHCLTKYNVRRAARIITVSRSTKRDVVERLGVSEEKVVVIHPGYTPKYRPINDEQHLEETRDKLKLPGKFILYVGNHKPHKNLMRLLEAYSLQPAALRSVYGLVLSGPITADTNKLRAKAKHLRIEDRIKFIGLIEQGYLPALYNLAALVVLPSLYEGFGLPLLEAMACGTCVACSDRAALPEVAGGAGRMFDPYSAEEMMHVLTKALEEDVGNPAARTAVLKRAAEFSWEKTAEETFRLYKLTAEVT